MNTPTIPTAKQFCVDNFYDTDSGFSFEHMDITFRVQVISSMQAFTKLHIAAALKCAAENADVYPNKCHDNGHPMINKETILNSYDLNNIK